MDLAEEELKLKCDIAGLAREGVTEKAAAVLITKKESLLTDIKKRIVKARDANLRLSRLQKKKLPVQKKSFVEPRWPLAMPKRRLSREKAYDASIKPAEKKQEQSLSSFGGKLLKSTAPSSLRKSFLPMTPNSSNVDC